MSKFTVKDVVVVLLFWASLTALFTILILAGCSTAGTPRPKQDASTPQVTKYFVDPVNGDDSNPGTKDKPWKHAPGYIYKSEERK